MTIEFLSNKKLINTTTTPPLSSLCSRLQTNQQKKIINNIYKPLQTNTNENWMKCQMKIEWILVREPHDNWTGAGTQIDSAPNWNYFQVFIGALFFNQTNEKSNSENLIKNQHALWFTLKHFTIYNLVIEQILIVSLVYIFVS